MKHILFIDPIEKLNIKKDSSLMLALALRKEGHEVYLLF
jgi:glutathione synthase